MASKVDSSGLSVISEERSSARKQHGNNDYCESLHNHKTRSIYNGGHKKKLHPLMLGPSRLNAGKLISLHSASKNNLSEFTQRIMSAKLLRVKQVQNQLNETQIQLNDLINENRILKNLLKRQEGALKKYEGNHAELPQLIRSHNEEIRTLKANNKIIKAQLKETNTKLKERENDLEALRDNYNKLKKLSTEKNLLEREKLHRKVEELQDIIKGQEEKIQVLSRKVLLESKNYRHHLNIEVIKHKETQKDLNSALSMISKLESQLMAKEKQLPGGKVLIKRDNKTLMPMIVNKSKEIRPKLGGSEDSFLNRDDGRRKSQISDSGESELEVLNGIGSSEDTPSPTQDIFPDIHKSKNSSPELETTTEITPSKSEMFNFNGHTGGQLGTLKSRKTPLLKKNARFSKDPEANARFIADKLNEDMETISNIAKNVDSSTSNLESKSRLSSLMEEINSTSSKFETEMNNDPDRSIQGSLLDEANVTEVEPERRRSVAKRKLEEKQAQQISEKSPDFDLEQELNDFQKQKLENMTKTWNNIKSKIQEERMKAEQKIKELSSLNGAQNSLDSDVESEKDEDSTPDSEIKPNKELKFVNFTEDAYILQELAKTDKIFNKLKNENRKSGQKVQSSSSSSSTDKNSKPATTPKPKPKQQPNIQNFRTESKREHKYLEEFQTEYQKENLLKALKAIDIGKDPNLSEEGTDESDSETNKKKLPFKSDVKHIQRISSGKSNIDLMTELFGTRHQLDKNENMKVEFGTVAGVNE